MKIWIDITNSPHVIFYYPIIQKMMLKGHKVSITARDYAQTKGLLELFDIEHTMIGGHPGKNKIKKLLYLLKRAKQLRRYAKGKGFDVAVSLSSQYVMLAARSLNIPHMTLFDYEYSTGHHISFRISKRILSPKSVPEDVLKKYGAKMERVTFYSGLKEQFYIHYYMNLYNQKVHIYGNPICRQLGIDKDRIIVVMRPEATVAHYQSNDNNISFDLVDYLDKHENNPVIIVLPRVEAQKQDYLQKAYKNVIIPDQVINGIDLIASCDLVVGAGGTINREAAAVGTPVYTIYQGGKMCAVDSMLIKTGRMVHIQNREDFSKIKIEKRRTEPECIGEDLSVLYLEMIERLIND